MRTASLVGVHGHRAGEPPLTRDPPARLEGTPAAGGWAGVGYARYPRSACMGTAPGPRPRTSSRNFRCWVPGSGYGVGRADRHPSRAGNTLLWQVPAPRRARSCWPPIPELTSKIGSPEYAFVRSRRTHPEGALDSRARIGGSLRKCSGPTRLGWLPYFAAVRGAWEPLRIMIGGHYFRANK